MPLHSNSRQCNPQSRSPSPSPDDVKKDRFQDTEAEAAHPIPSLSVPSPQVPSPNNRLSIRYYTQDDYPDDHPDFSLFSCNDTH
ncbi:hypothetical protein K491DRAFT_691543, partial [Lophiostoma macrostomum CBS 122681]